MDSTSRLEAKASQIINNNKITATNDTNEPIEEIAFHRVQASGQSEYRRGIPASPRKCCGKKVKFTPMNIKINWIFVQVECKVKPEINGNQWMKPAMIAKTAPIERT